MSAIFDRLLSANLKLNWVKSQWGQSSLVWYGRQIDTNSVALGKAKIQGLVNLAPPRTYSDTTPKSEIRSIYDMERGTEESTRNHQIRTSRESHTIPFWP
eukprot:TRINITY_DN6152_c0_g2_i3.p2 TRINITY_DN6152_c0_g2~~TRINITY_DN6152_c0_g2_i3.p2  ORF type:complete len:100 (-),score=4.61 TRINITY_DN6152_c0_g2_i3:208-507(-)